MEDGRGKGGIRGRGLQATSSNLTALATNISILISYWIIMGTFQRSRLSGNSQCMYLLG